MVSIHLPIIILAALLPASTFARTWPNPLLDELDSQRYDRTGYRARGFAPGVTPCTETLSGNNSGRATAADWIRTAYHDMATHNVADGTGGLDASIRFETGRAENVGDGFLLTLVFLFGEANRYTTFADALALGTITAIEQCGGPKVDFRGGRVDATEANAPGVPQPQDDLQSHIASFARQGFTQEDMIGLVACGHTFGGVQNTAFPSIVPPSDDPENTSGNVHFDATFVTFDNKVVTEYLDGTTGDPLVVGHNVTTNSDGRIFGSDGNKTMKALADTHHYRRTCATLYARMIDTVPTGVQLTEVIEPLPIKPTGVQLIYTGNGNLTLRGEARFWGMQEDPNRKIKILWADRQGHTCEGCSSELGHTIDQVGVFQPGNIQSLWYSFNKTADDFITVDENKSISKFWFEIEEGGESKAEDQGGSGYVLQDVVMLASTTCFGSGGLINMDIAVRKDVTPSRVYIELDAPDSNTGAPAVQTSDAALNGNSTVVDGTYGIWSVTFEDPMSIYNIAADVGGQKFVTLSLEDTQYPDC